MLFYYLLRVYFSKYNLDFLLKGILGLKNKLSFILIVFNYSFICKVVLYKRLYLLSYLTFYIYSYYKDLVLVIYKGLLIKVVIKVYISKEGF